MDLHNGLDIEVYDLRPTDLHYYYYSLFLFLSVCACVCVKLFCFSGNCRL